jgi:hypothetical protein
MDEFILYPRLCTRSRRAINRTAWRGRKYVYSPRTDLLRRLSEETGMSTEQCREQLHRERKWLLEVYVLV